MKNLLGLMICLLSNLQLFSQGDYFEGTVTYLHKESEGNGNPRSTPVIREKISLAKNIFLNENISGPALPLLGNYQVYLNSEKAVRYKIDHDNKVIKNIGMLKSEKLTPLEEKIIGEDEILGYSCIVHFLKYVNQFELPDGPRIDTLSCTYYNSKTLKIFRPERLGALQGNKNTLLLDGRYSGVPLKIVLKRQDNSMIIIEAEEIRLMNVDKFVKLPDYRFED